MKAIAKFVGPCLLLTACGQPTPDAAQFKYASGSHNGGNPAEVSHSLLIAQGVSLLLEDIASYSPPQQEFLKILGDHVNELQIGGDMPDKDERFPIGLVPTMKGHFYHYKNKTNYLGESSPTAMTEFLRHHERARAAMSQKDIETYLDETGRAMHYLSDSCVPQHATNSIAGLSWHVSYEAFINNIHLSEPDLLRATSYETLDSSSVGDLLDRCATKAASVISLAEAHDIDIEGTLQPDYDSWMQAVRVHVPYTQSILAAYLRKSMLQFVP